MKKWIVDKKWPVFFLVGLISLYSGYGQDYSVESHQKINELSGNFTGVLDLQDNFGVAIDNIGDLDGNGVNDLAVGAFSDDDGGNNRGAVWILFLNALDVVIAHTKISDTSGGFTGTLDNDDRFGGGVGYLGDMNGDGLIELAVTADYDGDGGFWHGAFYILSLNNDGTVNSHVKISDTEGNFTGNINGGAIFGTDIENIGDLNGDGIDDLAVGSRRDSDGGANRGALWILFMNNDFTVNSSQKVSSTNGNFSGGLQFEDFFGGSVTNIGDLNNDGIVDLAVGSYREDDLANNSGSFYILFMNTDGTIISHQQVSNSQGGMTFGISEDALFGESIDGIVDIDSDGKIEIVVGAMKQLNPTLSVPTGAFFIIELNNDGTVSEEHFYSYAENCFSGQLQSNDLFAGCVTVLSDTPGDVSIAVGAYGDGENGTNKGAVWILNLGEVMFSITDFQNPSACGAADGYFVISDLVAGSDYEVTYDFASMSISGNFTANINGEITISSLLTGTYENIIATEVITGCSGNLGQVFLDSPSLMLSVLGNEPSACEANDGSFTFSGAGVGLNYTISFEIDLQTTSLALTAGANGTITVLNLKAGSYLNILVTENSSGCTENLGSVELQCTPPENECFAVEKFFTPNGDDINEYWSLKPVNGGCDYTLSIFDRYGKLLIMLNPINEKWDGTFQGKKMPATDYWFVVNYTNGATTKVYRSHFTLKR